MKETGAFEDSEFYGFCEDFGNMAGHRQLELWGELKFKWGDLETYFEDTEEWREKRNFPMETLRGVWKGK